MTEVAKRRGGSMVGVAAVALLGVANVVVHPGCIAFYGSRKVTAQVVDGDTSAPLADATIEVRYPIELFGPMNRPRDVSVTTDADGAAAFRVATYQPITWHVSRPGYEPQTHSLFDQTIPEEFPREEDGRVRIPMYAPPAPEIVIVVPDGYRGPVAVAIDAAPSGLPPSPGARTLEVRAPSDGIVRRSVPGPFNLVEYPNPRVRMRFEDGTPLTTASCESYPDEVRQRRVHMWPSETRTRVLFVVGTSDQAKQVLAVIMPTRTLEGGQTVTSFDEPAVLRAFGETAATTTLR